MRDQKGFTLIELLVVIVAQSAKTDQMSRGPIGP
ncbi:MAG: type II secretion system protein [Phycisphaerae bacterium]|nr:type II secretion system protein [Phycisphaerae bacterium]